MIPFGPFEPDSPNYKLGSSINVVNCVPRGGGSWGPMPNFTAPPMAAALPSDCRGGCYVKRLTGETRIIVGTVNRLYEYNGTTFTDISGPSAPYHLAPGHKWWFAPFGNKLIAGNLNDPLQILNIDVGTAFADCGGSPPAAKHGWVAGSQLVIGNLASDQNRIKTSAIGNAEYWTAGKFGSDEQAFVDGGAVQGGLGTQGGAVVFQETKIRTMTLQTGTPPFRTDVVNDERGVIAPYSIAKIGTGTFVYLSADGFYLGAAAQPIGQNRVSRWFLKQINPSKLAEVKAMKDPSSAVVWFQGERSNGSKFKIGYSWVEDRWCYSDASFTELLSLLTLGVTIDGMDAYYGSIDAVDQPFDSALFTGGLPLLAAVTDSYKIGYASGASLAATLETNDTELTPGRRSFVSQVMPVMDGSTYTIRALTRDKPGGTQGVSDAVSPYLRTGHCHFRSSALRHGFRLEIPAGADWDNATGVDFPTDGVTAEGVQ